MSWLSVRSDHYAACVPSTIFTFDTCTARCASGIKNLLRGINNTGSGNRCRRSEVLPLTVLTCPHVSGPCQLCGNNFQAMRKALRSATRPTPHQKWAALHQADSRHSTLQTAPTMASCCCSGHTLQHVSPLAGYHIRQPQAACWRQKTRPGRSGSCTGPPPRAGARRCPAP